MDRFTQRQLHALSRAFYDERADAFDASRVELPWPGWDRLPVHWPEGRLEVLDIGCGNGRFAAWLADQDRPFDYVGTDASRGLLEAARARVGPSLTRAGAAADFLEDDFLADPTCPGGQLPRGPFSLVVLMGVLHHVPGASARRALLRAAGERVAPGGLLAVTRWQFADRPRFANRRVAWEDVGDVLGRPIDPAALEPGDALLRFGEDRDATPRYCHHAAESEFATWPEAAGLETVETFDADGRDRDLNRYWIGRRPRG